MKNLFDKLKKIAKSIHNPEIISDKELYEIITEQVTPHIDVSIEELEMQAFFFTLIH